LCFPFISLILEIISFLLKSKKAYSYSWGI